MLFSNKVYFFSWPISGMVKIKQQDVKDCGIACLASIGQHYGLHVSMAKIRQWAQTDLQGTNLMGMLHAAS
jgi:ATP-binding cassette subfamily B protein